MKRENILCKLKVLVFALIVSVAIIPQVSYAKEKPALTKTEVAIGKKKSIDINIKNKVKGSRYKWTSSNEEVATVNEKGVITGKKGGDAVIICTVTTPAGKVYKLSCDVSINTKSKVTVFNQKDLEKALADKDVQQIIIKTKTSRKFVIPENDYTDKRLYIKAPNAEIENNGSFKSVHAYVSNQAELEKALAYDKVTIITIETNNKVNFTIEGNYSNIRLIVNAPNAQVVTKAIFRKVDITAVKEIESKDYDKTTEDSLIDEQGEETKVNNEKQQNNENIQDENSLNKNDEKQENAGNTGNTGNAGNAAGGFPVVVGPVFPGNTGENDGTDTPKPEPLPGTGGDSGNEENPGAKPGETSTPETDEKAGDNPTPGTDVKPEETPTPGTDVKPGETPTPETDEKPGETPTTETDEKAGETPTPGTDVKPGETPTTETDEKPEETPTSGTDPKSEETPSSGSDSETGKEDLQLKKAKEDAIAAIYKEAEKYKSKLNNKELNDFNDMLQYYINNINKALTVGGVEEFKNSAIENIRTFKLEDDEDAFEKTKAREYADYQAFLNGTMSLQELYDKYAHGDNGYEYSYVDGGPFMLDFDRMETFLYVIPEENRVDFFDDNSDGKYNYRPDFEEKRTILHNRYGEEVETYYIGSVNGMIVSYNNTTRTICVKDLVNCETHFIQTMDSPATEWEEDGKIYYGYPSNPESLNVIYTKDGMAEINLKTFSDSSITFMVYMNNVESINRICHHKSAKELDTSYYSVVYHENNMADVIFNQLFIDTFIKTVTEDTLLQFVMFPSEDTSNGVGLNFEITAE